MIEYLISRCKCGSITAGGIAGMDPKGDHEFLRDHPGAEYVSDPPILQSCRCLARAEALADRLARILEAQLYRLTEPEWTEAGAALAEWRAARKDKP